MYSRRDFGKIALAGIPLSMALAKIDSKIGGVQIGVQSYSFRDRSLDDAINAMVEDGLGECELYSGHVEPKQQRTSDAEARKAAREELRKWRLTVPLDEIRAVRKKFDDAGIALFAYNLSFREDFTDEEIDRGFQMANALGVKVITASSTISAMPRVVPFAEKHKIMVGVHGHDNVKDSNEFATPETFAKAMAMSKYVGVNLDIGHFTAAGFDPVAYIQEHHARITNLHLKDRKKDTNWPGVPFGEGNVAITQVLKLLKEKKYNLPANIEYEYRGKDDATVEVKKCFDYCKAALA
jgi:sugar phosphate isomerase/epimerase